MVNLDICKISCHLLHRNCVSRTGPITLLYEIYHFLSLSVWVLINFMEISTLYTKSNDECEA